MSTLATLPGVLLARGLTAAPADPVTTRQSRMVVDEWDRKRAADVGL